MGYQPRSKSPRGSGRGSIKSPYDRVKGRGRKRRPADDSKVEEKQVASAKEVSEKTITRLRVLGNQRFGSSPFRTHFERWMVNLKDVLGEFESNPNISSDEQFVEERSQIISTVEVELEQRRREETILEEAYDRLSNSKILLRKIKQEYDAGASKILGRKKSEIRRLYKNVDDLKEELDYIVRMRTGLFRGISKKEREQKETVAMQKLNDKQRELELAMLDLTETKERLRDAYDAKKQPIMDQIRDSQRKIASLETDGSLEQRWFACEALVDAVNTLLERKTLKLP